MGTVTDVSGDAIPNASVVLKEVDSSDPRTIVTTENGMFKFHDVAPGIPYQLMISANGFEDWTSPPIIVNQGQFKIVSGIKLRIATEHPTVDVHYDPVEVAIEQFKAEEKRRVFRIVPNFYVSYEDDSAPLTTKDDVQAGAEGLHRSGDGCWNFPCGKCQARWKYAELWPRIGSIWKALWRGRGRWFFRHHDRRRHTTFPVEPALLPPGNRYGRLPNRHAVFRTFVARADNGNSQPNYSGLGGVLASSSLANLHYPRSNRGAGLVFGNFAIGIAERIGAKPCPGVPARQVHCKQETRDFFHRLGKDCSEGRA